MDVHFQHTGWHMALALFVLVSGYVCYHKLILSFWVHVKLFYHIVSYVPTWVNAEPWILYKSNVLSQDWTYCGTLSHRQHCTSTKWRQLIHRITTSPMTHVHRASPSATTSEHVRLHWLCDSTPTQPAHAVACHRLQPVTGCKALWQRSNSNSTTFEYPPFLVHWKFNLFIE